MRLKEALESLDIEFELGEGDMLTDVLVIAKVARLDGPTTILHATTVGTDGITKLGLVTAANEIIKGNWERFDREDGD